VRVSQLAAHSGQAGDAVGVPRDQAVAKAELALGVALTALILMSKERSFSFCLARARTTHNVDARDQ